VGRGSSRVPSRARLRFDVGPIDSRERSRRLYSLRPLRWRISRARPPMSCHRCVAPPLERESARRSLYWRSDVTKVERPDGDSLADNSPGLVPCCQAWRRDFADYRKRLREPLEQPCCASDVRTHSLSLSLSRQVAPRFQNVKIVFDFLCIDCFSRTKREEERARFLLFSTLCDVT